MLVASTSVFGFNCTLFPPPALGERRHRGPDGSRASVPAWPSYPPRSRSIPRQTQSENQTNPDAVERVLLLEVERCGRGELSDEERIALADRLADYGSSLALKKALANGG